MQVQTEKEHELLSTRMGKDEVQRIDDLVESGVFLNRSDFLRQAAREKLGSIRLIKVRKLKREEAKQEILQYLDENGKSYGSDIADDLSLDFALVVSILKELKGEDRVS